VKGTQRIRRIAVVAVVLVMATSCAGHPGGQGPPPLRPMPSGVPTHPMYPDADAIVAKLGQAGLPCRVLNRPQGDPSVGDTLICESMLQGLRFRNEIHTYNPAKVSRARLGNAVSISLDPPYSNTIVAAGNWYIRVVGDQPAFAHRVAEALDGAVLRPGPPSPTASMP